MSLHMNMVNTVKIKKRLGSIDNDTKYFRNLLLEDIKTVGDPFGGSVIVLKTQF